MFFRKLGIFEKSLDLVPLEGTPKYRPHKNISCNISIKTSLIKEYTLIKKNDWPVDFQLFAFSVYTLFSMFWFVAQPHDTF